ncbi:Dynamin family protein [Lutibacter agarilyticus]|uniref:Dynamin family protein n=1 Tax=Lutibacter agarilyticus TaxID=1109740 RepID=A0A238WWM6_9FLAO|nr:dynamin family protein [Lutibacter agarilyticus]SNR51035.1 Dynamin family protein [Lutibacter agarilyticus]
MSNNIFKSIADKKEDFKRYAQKALDFKWISQDEFDGIINKLEKDVLTIGVIGQMKCGKSTFLNALLFGEEKLPAATTPMTASLSIITYGEQNKLEAEFYTSNEWEELKHLSKRSIEEVESDDNLKTKIKAAKEIVDKSLKIESEIRNLLGTKKEDEFNKLIDYVGANGKYIAITKSVKIFMPLDYLKGVEIVDTPGFNDPIVSREERTKDFLTKADAVIMLLYAGRAFDSVDKDIIFNQLRTIGIGKLLIGVNKYDLCIENESENEIVSNVKNQLLLASKEYHNNSIAELVTEKDPLLLSASMALMSKMKFEEISKDSDWDFYYKNASDVFGISSQKEMFEKSKLSKFEDALMGVIFDSKDEILLKKPRNFIKQKGENKTEELTSAVNQTKNKLVSLNKPDVELEEQLKNTKKSERKINRKINNLEIDIEEVLRRRLKDLTRKTEDLINASKSNCKRIIDDNGIVVNSSNLNLKLESEIEDLEILLKRLFEKSNDDINYDLKKLIDNFICEIEEIAEDNLEDFDMQDYIISCKKMLFRNIINLDFRDLIPSSEESEEGDSLFEKALSLSASFIDGATFGILKGTISTTLNVMSGKKDAREWVDYFYSILNLEPIENEIFENGVDILEEIKRKFMGDFLTPIIEHTEELIKNKDNRENDLLVENNKLSGLEKEKEQLEGQMGEIELLV